MSVVFNLTGIGTAQSLSVPDGSTLTAVATTTGAPSGPQPNGPDPSLYTLTQLWDFRTMTTLPIVDAAGTIPNPNYWKVYGGFGYAWYIDDTSPDWVTPGIDVGNPFQLDPTAGLKMISKQNADGTNSGAFLQSFNNQGLMTPDNGFRQAGGYFEASMKLPPQTNTSQWGAWWAYTVGDGQYYSEIDWEFGYNEVSNFFYMTAGFHRWPLTSSGTHSELYQFLTSAQLSGLSDSYHTYGWEIIVSTSVINFWLDGVMIVSYAAPPELLTPVGLFLDMTMNSRVGGLNELDVQYVAVWQHI